MFYNYVRDVMRSIEYLDSNVRYETSMYHSSILIDTRIFIKRDIDVLQIEDRKCLISYEEIQRFYSKANHDEAATKYYIFNLIIERLDLFSEYRKLKGFLNNGC